MTSLAGHRAKPTPRGAVWDEVVGPSSARNARIGTFYCDEHHSVALSGNVVVTYSTDTPNPSYLAAWGQATAQLAERVAGSLAVLTIIDGRTSSPSESSRKSIRETINKHKHQIAALAYVVEGRGFAAAAVRSALSLIGLAARYPFPQKVFGSVDEAAVWIAHRSGRKTPPAQIVATVEMMRKVPGLAAAG